MTELDFAQKRKALFDSLADAEQGLAGSSLEQSRSARLEDFQHEAAPRRKTSRSSGDSNKPELMPTPKNRKESMFKRPALPIGKCLAPRRRPDYQVNPEKWKKYSLEDVDCSDRTNTSAAFSFLRGIEKQKEEEGDEESDSIPQRITFKKSTKLKAESGSGEEEKAVVRGAKVIMPEYVVGQKKKKPERQPRRRQEKTKELKLQHLMEDEEDE